ncbi:NAD P-binding protein [Gloeophyllum trabeum ATCC 11539]|uniref:Probable quinone oxidoreductase n=1 Tax=Gloeophyllum trabeum (strain ATCC 11539 / FP-39264 / Madison 617) TaxID=670483 RepID=S7QKE0_GLOTA|nr:NAD P-binding protein [Gloeophyllum trabeum ATCC 11539]EPQ60226.1 NAD P-binding protein [Gloeophyllum trabeum ATCC 11539]
MSNLPATIEAITIPKTGDVDVIEKTTQPFPKVTPESIVVKIEYGGVNFIDTYFRKGLYPIESFPFLVGREAAGTIVALPTSQELLNSEAYKKRNYQIGGKVALYAPGTFATYVAVPWTSAYPVPSGISTLTASAALTQGLTTNTLMTESYNVKKGDTILVHTVAGGLGLLFAQYAKYRGATVIGTTSTKEKAELAKRHGADHVILYKDEDTVKRVLEITNGKGVDAIFDGVGKDTFESDFEMIKRKGTIVSVGNASGAVPPFPPLKLTPKNIRIVRPTMGNYVVTPEEQEHYGNELWDLISKGVLKINVFKEYEFSAEGVKQAQTDLVSGKTTGKLVIKIGN